MIPDDQRQKMPDDQRQKIITAAARLVVSVREGAVPETIDMVNEVLEPRHGVKLRPIYPEILAAAQRLVAVGVQEPPPAPTTEDELPPPPPPVMTWEQMEQGQGGLSNITVPPPVPTMAERAFLKLAREWLVEVEKIPKDNALSCAADELALACLLLAVEWGAEFTDVARQQMEVNREAVAARDRASWIDQLPWKLCLAANLASPPQSDAVEELIANLDHHNSSIRCWMMKLGWMAVPWIKALASTSMGINPVEAAVRLLKNLADTLGGPFMAAGLAARLFDKADGFLSFAKDYARPAQRGEDEECRTGMMEQYQDRLKYVEEHGIQAVQAPFWQAEALCRREIEKAGLGFKVRKVGKQRA